MLKWKTGAGLLFAGALVMGACVDENAQMDEVPPASEVPSAAPETGFTDADVVSAVDALNTTQIEEAEQALERSQSDEVRNFAQRMITDHQALQARAGELSLSDVPPASGPSDPTQTTPSTGMQDPDAVLDMIRQSSEDARSQLEGVEGAEFDRQYMSRQVQAHQQALDLIDQQLMPATQDATLRQVLEEARPVIEAHLQMARDLEQQLGTADAAATDTTGGN